MFALKPKNHKIQYANTLSRSIATIRCNLRNQSILKTNSRDGLTKCSKNIESQFPQLNYNHQHRAIWIPPVWLRPLLRPLALIIASFLGGAILQMLKGTPAQLYELRHMHILHFCYFFILIVVHFFFYLIFRL